MSSIRGNWLGYPLATIFAMGMAAAIPDSTLAQGFGPDPFRPYNSQYDAYTYPIGQVGADAALSRMGNRNANQFQDFMNDLQGSARGAAGTPYFRSAVDSSFSQKLRDAREYRPNRLTDLSFEETQQQLSEKYFAYFEEKDPTKRARLLKDYNQARRQSTRALSVRRENPGRILDSASRLDPDRRSGAAAGRRAPGQAASPDAVRRFGAVPDKPDDSILGGGAPARAGASRSRSTPPPPALPFDRSSRTGARRSATDVLDRARSLGDNAAGSGTSVPEPRVRRRPPVPTLPGTGDEIP